MGGIFPRCFLKHQKIFMLETPPRINVCHTTMYEIKHLFNPDGQQAPGEMGFSSFSEGIALDVII